MEKQIAPGLPWGAARRGKKELPLDVGISQDVPPARLSNGNKKARTPFKVSGAIFVVTGCLAVHHFCLSLAFL